MGGFGGPAADDNWEKKTSQLNAVFLVKLFQRVKRLSSLHRHFSNFLKTESRVAFLFF